MIPERIFITVSLYYHHDGSHGNSCFFINLKLPGKKEKRKNNKKEHNQNKFQISISWHSKCKRIYMAKEEDYFKEI